MKTIKLVLVILFSIAIASCGGGVQTQTPAAPSAIVVNNSGGRIDHVTIGNVTFTQNLSYNTSLHATDDGSYCGDGCSTANFDVAAGAGNVMVYATATSTGVSAGSLGSFDAGNHYAVNIRKVSGNYCAELWKRLDTNTIFNSDTTRVLVSSSCTGSVPSTPTGVSATAGNGQVTISWTAVSGATSYNLYMATQSGVTKSNYTTLADGMAHPGVTSPYVHTGLTNGTTYYYVVTAVNASGESVESTGVSVTPTVLSQFDGTYTGSWSNTDSGNTATGTFTITVVNGVLLNYQENITSGNFGILFSSGAVSSSGAITGTGNAPSQCSLSVGAFTGQVTATLQGGADMTMTYTRTADVLCAAETGTLTATRTTTGTGVSQLGGSIQGNSLNLANVVSTFAGAAGTAGSTDGTGSAARFNEPRDITTDGVNLYVLDKSNHTIRKVVIATGAVTTLAGSAGVSGSADGTGTAARFNTPKSITTDGTNLYVGDSLNFTIRKVVIATGVVTTIAGSAGVTGSADGTGSAARFNGLSGITTDGTNLYAADSWNHSIRKVVIATGVVTTIAGSAGVAGSTDGTGTAAFFNHPVGVTTDGTNLYVLDTDNHTIRKVAIATGVVTTIAGNAGVAGYTDGTGMAARFNTPGEITMDGTNLYVTDELNSTIRKMVIATGVVTTIAGNAGVSGATDGTGTAALFNTPRGITTDGTNLYVADMLNHTIRKIQ